MSRLQLSIRECLRDHEETILVFLRSWSRYFSCMYFHVFSDKLQKTLVAFLFACFFFCFFFHETAFSSILRVKTIFFGFHSILREKNLS